MLKVWSNCEYWYIPKYTANCSIMLHYTAYDKLTGNLIELSVPIIGWAYDLY